MRIDKISTSNTERKWFLVTLRTEITTLRREQAHLVAKSQERPLTTWETDRLNDLARELLSIWSRVSRLPVEATSRRIGST